jgi:hypothetical protein
MYSTFREGLMPVTQSHRRHSGISKLRKATVLKVIYPDLSMWDLSLCFCAVLGYYYSALSVTLIRTLLSPVISPDLFGSGRLTKHRKIDSPVICRFNRVIRA